MTIAASSFFQQKLGQFNAQASHARFVNDYVIAVNRTLKTLYTRLDLASAPTSVTDTDTDIDLDDDYQAALSASVDYWLVVAGHKSGDLDIKTAEAAMKEFIADAICRRDLDIDATEVANEEYNMIGEFYE